MRSLLQSFVLILFSLAAHGQGFVDVSSQYDFPEGYDGIGYTGGLSFVDFDQDGFDDLTFANGNGFFSNDQDSPQFFLNTDTGMTKIDLGITAIGLDVKQIAWVDIDNDHDLDFFLTSSSGSRLFENTGDLQFVDISILSGIDPFQGSTYSATWLDYDEDGLLDLVLPDRGSSLPEHLNLYHNIGNGQFEDVTTEAGLSGVTTIPLSISTLDYNNDGLEDIYVGEDFNFGNVMLKNNGDGTFTDVSVITQSKISAESMTVTVGDINNDGWMDIYVSDTDSCKLILNDGNGVYENVTSDFGLGFEAFTWAGLFFDVDNDMDQDLIINSYGSGLYAMKNLGGNEGFENATTSWGFQFDFNDNAASAIGDYNRDGSVDFSQIERYSTLIDNKNSLWENQFSINNHFSFQLIGTYSNSFAVGAVISVHTGGIQQTKRVGCGENYASQNSYIQYFGLGQETLIDSVKILWPNGLDTMLYDLPANQTLTIIEGGQTFGCTDPEACNYEPEADIEDNTCLFPEPLYDCDGSCNNDINENDICDELEISACIDPAACNFNPNATLDDDSCVYLETYDISGNLMPSVDQSEIYSYPATVGSTYNWEVQGGTIVSGQGTSIIIVDWSEVGTGSIAVTETNDLGCQAQSTLNLEVLITGLSEYRREAFHIYPNPSDGTFIIVNASDALPGDLYTLMISDAKGRTIATLQTTFRSMDDEFKWIISSALDSGIYVLEILSGSSHHAVLFAVE